MGFRSKFFGALPLFVAFALLSVMLTRCGENRWAPAPPIGSFEDVYEKIKKGNCTECHVPTASAYKDDGVLLDFSTIDKAYASMTVNPKNAKLPAVVTGKSSKTICADVRIVTPKAVNKSYFAAVLYDTVHKDDFAGKKGCTPYATHLTDTNMAGAEKSIKKWIEDGALRKPN